MLHLATVDKATLKLLKSLSSRKELQDFSLAGGTGLALQLGHRVSVDLDFFTHTPFDSNRLFEYLREFYTVRNCTQSANSLSLFIEMETQEIKVDFLRHNYKLLQPNRIDGHIRIFSMEDIGAMKLNAIANRGAKKDFYDIYALLKIFSLNQLLEFFQQKYEQFNSFTVVKSLAYFVDADLEPDPICLKGTRWEEIKKTLRSRVKGINI